MAFRAGGYTLGTFTGDDEEEEEGSGSGGGSTVAAFATAFALQLGVPAATVLIREVRMAASVAGAGTEAPGGESRRSEPLSVSFDVEVRCTKAQAQDVIFKLKLASGAHKDALLAEIGAQLKAASAPSRPTSSSTRCSMPCLH